jgi:tetratricopeptide (TPR) repeat protein
MASLIPGFEYDIFISYRQKDNKYDGWVTEFVDNLKKELEATFKEEISVYFDINPHDGLLETHDVDASLKEKLRCLVFIPIISRTYCDPKSFAWEHEFKVFVEQASQDKFGLKIKLPNSNVANRVLPVRIHDLDQEDIKLCESILGGVLRGVEFIYMEPGVNRSLSSKDREEKNLNNTSYRNQINKVALAIKELLLGMKRGHIEGVIEAPGQKEHSWEIPGEEKKVKYEEADKSKRQRLMPFILIAIVLVVALIFAFPKIFKKERTAGSINSGGKISVAVMPFQNMTGDTAKYFWQEMIQDNLITSLSDSRELQVRRSESVKFLIHSKNLTNNASLTPSVAKVIAQKLDADILIYGSIQRAGNKLRLSAKLVYTKTDEVLKPFEIDAAYKDDIILDITDSLRKMVTDFLVLSKLIKDEPPDLKPFGSISSPDAFRYFLEGNDAFTKSDMITARSWFSKAIGLDSNYVQAYIGFINSIGSQGKFEEAKKWCLKLYKKREQMVPREKCYVNWLYAHYFGTPDEELKYLRQVLEIDDQEPISCFLIGFNFNKMYQYDKAIPEYEKALEIYDKWDTSPNIAFAYTGLVTAYYETGQYKKAKKLLKESEKYFPDDEDLTTYKAIVSLCLGDTVAANDYIKKYISRCKENSASEAVIANGIASIYWESGFLDKAEEYDRKALSLEPDNIEWMIILAYLLIDKDRNIKEGLELADKALKLAPDNFRSLHCKGWGFYKQGKYKEALEILQKSWDLRREFAIYNHDAFLHLVAAKKAVAGNR